MLAAPTQEQKSMRIYTTTITEVLENMAIVIGTLPVSFVPTRVLFDFVYIHSFISCSHTSRSGGQIEHLGHSLLVSTPVSGVVATNECMHSVLVKIEQ